MVDTILAEAALKSCARKRFNYSETENKIYGIDHGGQVETTLNLSELRFGELQGMVFADSTDPTDDPAQQNLFLASSGETAAVIELSLTAISPLAVPADAKPTTLVNIIDSSLWDPPNPDTSGVEFLYGTNRLFVVDVENVVAVFRK